MPVTPLVSNGGEIGADEIEAPEFAYQALGFERREAARLRRPVPGA